MNNLMLDIETLGVSPEAPIISIGAVFFDLLTGEVGNEFYKAITISSALQNSVVDPDTLKWWMLQSRAARQVFNDDSALDLQDALTEFSCFIKQNENVNVWGNGASFDNVILASAYRKCGLAIPWSFRNDRDVRTIVELAKSIKGINVRDRFTIDPVDAHHALKDAKFQVKYVSLAFRMLST